MAASLPTRRARIVRVAALAIANVVGDGDLDVLVSASNQGRLGQFTTAGLGGFAHSTSTSKPCLNPRERSEP